MGDELNHHPNETPTRMSSDSTSGGSSPLFSVAVITCLGIAALLVGPIIPRANAVVVALVMGLIIANASAGSFELDQAVNTFMLKRVLATAIILLGAGIDLRVGASVGGGVLAVISIGVVLAVLIAAFAGSQLGLNYRSSVLIGVGTAICGASAIVAVAPVLKARKDEIGIALGTVLSFNAVALLAYPIIAPLLGMDGTAFGIWAGVAVHDTASAVATGFTLGSESGEMATLVKLTRTLFLIPVMLLITVWMSLRNEQRGTSASQTAHAVVTSVPWFVVGFAALATTNSIGWLGSAADVLNQTAKYLIVFVVGAVGLTVKVRTIALLGRRVFYTGFAASISIGVVSFLMIQALQVGP